MRINSDQRWLREGCTQTSTIATTPAHKKVSLRARVVAAAGALVLALIASVAAPAQSAPQNNGNAKIAGSQCEQGFKAIVASGAVQATGSRDAFFTCSSGGIVIDVKSADKKKSDQLILANPQTLQTRSINGLGPAQRDRAASELGLNTPAAQARTGAPANECLPGVEEHIRPIRR